MYLIPHLNYSLQMEQIVSNEAFDEVSFFTFFMYFFLL